ncbi:MAG: polysaccharide export protein [Caulobacteraceae bacterium]|nr:polysaccharide export protein [Caulobacteraceae bacterium]
MPHTPVLMRALSLSVLALVAGCSTLPRDGPTGKAVDQGAGVANTPGSYTILDLDYAASERIKAQPPRFFGSLEAGSSQDVSGLIGVGDVLAVSIYEPSGSLFGGGAATAASASSVARASVRADATGLPPIVVDAAGAISIPFAGSINVAGATPGEAAARIRRALIGKVINPQVVVSVSESTFNTVTVLGEVKSPGRAPLSPNADRMVDVIAARGGSARPPEDVLVTLQREGQTYTAPLSAVLDEFSENIRLSRGDRINLAYKPRRFSTFGALSAVTEVEMGAGNLSLAGALSKVGGLDTNSANARSVLVFRFERPEVAAALGITQTPQRRGVPVVYRLNLEAAEGFFIANNFQIQPEDIIYVPRSGSAELSKFFTLVRSISGVIYDISVTNTLTTN